MNFRDNKGKRGPWGEVLYNILKGGNTYKNVFLSEDWPDEPVDDNEDYTPFISGDDSYNIFGLRQLLENTSHHIDAVIPEELMYNFFENWDHRHPLNLLMWAAKCNNVGAVELLLEKGADPTRRLPYTEDTAVQIALSNVFQPWLSIELLSTEEEESRKREAVKILKQLLDETNENTDLLGEVWKFRVRAFQTDHDHVNDGSLEARAVELLQAKKIPID